MTVQVDPYTFSNGTVADALEVNARFNPLYTLQNGGIDGTNMNLAATNFAWTGPHTWVTTTTTGNAVAITASSLTTGSALNILSNSADTGTRSLVTIKNDNTAATGATVLKLTQDAAATPILDLIGSAGTSVATVSSNGTTTLAGNLVVDTTTLVVNATANTVSVGSATAGDSPLHVFSGSAGSVTARSGTLLTLESSDASTSSLSFLSPNTAAQQINFGDADDNDVGVILYNHATNALQLYANATGLVNISSNKMSVGALTVGDSSLHVFDGSAGTVDARSGTTLTVENSGAVNCISMLSPNTAVQEICFGDVDDNDVGVILYDHTTNVLNLYNNAALALSIASTQVATFSAAVKADTTSSAIGHLARNNTTDAWANVSVSTTTPTVNRSKNVTNIVRAAQGKWDCNLSVTADDGNYCINHGSKTESSAAFTDALTSIRFNSVTTGDFELWTVQAAIGPQDNVGFFFSCVGLDA